jgi:hypothetical protein
MPIILVNKHILGLILIVDSENIAANFHQHRNLGN